MDPSRKIPSNMKGLSTKGLLIPWKMTGLQLALQNAANLCELHGKWTEQQIQKLAQNDPKRKTRNS